MRRLAAVLTVLCWTGGVLADGGVPLSRQIDTLIASKAGRAPVRCDDAEFLRRITLDLAGRVPSTAEARQFLQDSTADKRVHCIDRLLNSPEYARRMRDAFHVMLMERLGDHPEWSRYLQEAFAKNTPWDRLVQQVLAPAAEDESLRGAAFFLSKRLENYGQNPVDLPALTRDVGRLFLGVDLQCAQCHDHLFIDDYKQEDFQGLFAFFSQTYLRTDVKFPAIAEKPVGKKTEFMSVFIKEPRQTGPRIPGGLEIDVPALPQGEEFSIPPDPKTRAPGVPRFSPLRLLAEQLPRGETTQFARNAVNRLWWLMLGRGLVHPLDLHHSDNPAAHPELLELLAREFVARKFDIRDMLREIALSDTYQAQGQVTPDSRAAPELFVVALEKPLSAEQMLWSMLQATGELDRLRAEKPEGGDSVVSDELRARFTKAFANPPREPEVEFAPSVKAALFLMNDDVVLTWLKPQAGNLVERAAALPDAAQVADEVYLAVLSRPPTAAEREEVAAHLASNPGNPAEAIGQLVWALLASTEFAVNH